jgi:hypothetical protein
MSKAFPVSLLAALCACTAQKQAPQAPVAARPQPLRLAVAGLTDVTNPDQMPTLVGIVDQGTCASVGATVAEDNQAKLEAALGATHQRDLYFPPGTYCIKGTVTVASERTIAGLGSDSIIAEYTANTPLFQTTDASNVTISSLNFQLDNTSATAGAIHVTGTGTTRAMKIVGNTFSLAASSAADRTGITLAATTVRELWVNENTALLTRLMATTSTASDLRNLFISRNKVSGASVAALTLSASGTLENILINQNSFYDISTEAVVVKSVSGGTPSITNLQIAHNAITVTSASASSEPGPFGVSVRPLGNNNKNVIISGNLIHGLGDTGATSHANGIRLRAASTSTGAWVQSLVMTDNLISGGGDMTSMRTGIETNFLRGAVITNNQISGVRTGINIEQYQGLSLRNNTVRDYYYGLFLGFGSDGLVSGNRLDVDSASPRVAYGFVAVGGYFSTPETLVKAIFRSNRIATTSQGTALFQLDDSHVELRYQSNDLRGNGTICRATCTSCTSPCTQKSFVDNLLDSSTSHAKLARQFFKSTSHSESFPDPGGADPDNREFTLAVEGAVVGDPVAVAAPPPPLGLNAVVTGYVSSAGNVTFRILRVAGSGTYSGDFAATVFQHEAN